MKTTLKSIAESREIAHSRASFVEQLETRRLCASLQVVAPGAFGMSLGSGNTTTSTNLTDESLYRSGDSTGIKFLSHPGLIEFQGQAAGKTEPSHTRIQAGTLASASDTTFGGALRLLVVPGDGEVAGDTVRLRMRADIIANLYTSGTASSVTVKYSASYSTLLKSGTLLAPGEFKLTQQAAHPYIYGTEHVIPVKIGDIVTLKAQMDGTQSWGSAYDNNNGTVSIGSSDQTLNFQYYFLHDDYGRVGDALDLGSMKAPHYFQKSIELQSDVDLYKFSVTEMQRVSFDVDSTSDSFNSYVRIFDEAGKPLTKDVNGRASFNDDAPGPDQKEVDSYLEYTFKKAGTYYVGISNSKNTAYDAATGADNYSAANGTVGKYLLEVRSSITTDVGPGSDLHFDLKRQFSNAKNTNLFSAAIDITRPTLIVIHGRHSSGDAPNISTLAETIAAKRPKEQVLTLDWSHAAGGPFAQGEKFIPTVGQWAARALRSYGFGKGSFVLVGHSWGSYVAGELAKAFPGGVYGIIALDPAAHPPSAFYNPEKSINFRANSRYAWAFYADGILGNSITAATADEAFVVNGSDHSSMVSLFTNMQNHSDAVSNRFSLAQFIKDGDGTFGPFRANRFNRYGGTVDEGASAGRFEGVLTATLGGVMPSELLYIDKKSGKTVLLQAKL